MAHSLPELPYAKDALAPVISAETLDFHHGKHHAGYVAKLNGKIAGTRLENLGLVELVNTPDSGVFNLAAQHWNHSFYWKCMTPSGGGAPKGSLLAAIEKTWGGFDAFKKAFQDEAVNHFGSGWAWLVKKGDGTLAITSTHDADTPIAHGQTPIFTVDVWEHAYYIDYRNDRATFVSKSWDLANWGFASENFGG